MSTIWVCGSASRAVTSATEYVLTSVIAWSTKARNPLIMGIRCSFESMKKHIYLFALILRLTATNVSCREYRIAHLDAESWWVGMKEGQLELLVHGDQIADLTPNLSYPGVTIKNIVRVANQNYLFIDLDISATAAAGTLVIDFELNHQTRLSYPYPLNDRKEDSALRKGFSSSDAIYLIVPDRFANGDSRNDHIATFRESVNRA